MEITHSLLTFFLRDAESLLITILCSALKWGTRELLKHTDLTLHIQRNSPLIWVVMCNSFFSLSSALSSPRNCTPLKSEGHILNLLSYIFTVQTVSSVHTERGLVSCGVSEVSPCASNRHPGPLADYQLCGEIEWRCAISQKLSCNCFLFQTDSL